MTSSSNTALALLRVTFGTVLLAHGLLKIFAFTLAGTVGFFGSLGLPPVAAYLTIFGEVTGGIGLILGIQTRLVALLSLPIMLGATWVHAGNGWLFSAPNGGWEFPAVLSVLAVVLTLSGGGSMGLHRLNPLDRFLPQALRS